MQETRKKKQTKKRFFTCILAWDRFFFNPFSEEFVAEISKIYRFSLFFFIVKEVNYVPFVIESSLIKSE